MNYSKRLLEELLRLSMQGDLFEGCILFVGEELYKKINEEGEIKSDIFHHIPIYSSPQISEFRFTVVKAHSNGGYL